MLKPRSQSPRRGSREAVMASMTLIVAVLGGRPRVRITLSEDGDRAVIELTGTEGTARLEGPLREVRGGTLTLCGIDLSLMARRTDTIGAVPPEHWQLLAEMLLHEERERIRADLRRMRGPLH